MEHRPVVIGTRAREQVLPLALGDVSVARTLDYRRVPITPDHWSEPHYDVSETSFSRYVRAKASGDTDLIGLPIFVMRAFRHRCILVHDDSDLVSAGQLRGARVGLTGWPDSGNVWTRAVLDDAGVGLADVEWSVGRLTTDHPRVDRLGGVTPSVPVTELDHPSLMGELMDGRLDAVMTPFMPPGFHTDQRIRTLNPDVRAAETDYFSRRGFVPGIHLLTVRTESLRSDPGLAQTVIDAFERSKHRAVEVRSKLVDVLPWHNVELAEAVSSRSDARISAWCSSTSTCSRI